MIEYFRLIQTPKPRPVDSAFTNFLANLALNGTYTTNLDALNRCYQAIPYEGRNADLTMVAGAYKVGQIACYDNVGNIVDLGFSRSGEAWAYNSGEYIRLLDDMPRLDSLFYKRVYAYLIEDVRQIDNSEINISSWYPPVGVTYVNSALVGDVSFSRCFEMTEDMSFGNHLITHQYYGDYTNVNFCFFIKRLSGDRNISIVTEIGKDISMTIDLDSGTVLLRNSNIIPSYSITKLDNGWLFVKFLSPFSAYGWSNGNFIFTKSNGETVYQGDTNNKIAIAGFCGYMGAVDLSVKQSVSMGTSIYTFAKDAIAPILLTNNARIYIKTASRLQVVELSAGSNFNVNDYVANDKLICFTLKYI